MLFSTQLLLGLLQRGRVYNGSLSLSQVAVGNLTSLRSVLNRFDLLLALICHDLHTRAPRSLGSVAMHTRPLGSEEVVPVLASHTFDVSEHVLQFHPAKVLV